MDTMYGMCFYIMSGEYDESLSSIIDFETLDVISIIDEGGSGYIYNEADHIYNCLISDYDDRFAVFGEDSSTFMPESEDRKQIISAALLLNDIKNYDVDEIVNTLIKNIIVKNDLSATYNFEISNEMYNLGCVREGYNEISKVEVTLKNTGIYPLTFGEFEKKHPFWGYTNMC